MVPRNSGLAESVSGGTRASTVLSLAGVLRLEKTEDVRQWWEMMTLSLYLPG